MPFLRSRGISRIDELMVTHSDGDHCGGMPHLLARITAGRLLVSAHQAEQPQYLRGLALAAARGARIDTVRGYDTLDGIAPCRGFVFGRTDPDGRGNEGSLVAAVSYGRHLFFFAGDMGPALEDTLRRRGLLGRCTVLKVPHHGSRVNNAQWIIDAFRPEVCVIPVGERNRFGHPAPEVVDGYRRAGARVLRTDRCGAVVITCDGLRYSVSTMADGG